MARFWLERGVDGFRLDTINFYFHDPELRDNPALSAEDRNDTIAPSVNPYNWQDHLYDKNRPENLDFLRRFRAVLNDFPAATCVGEVGDAQRGTEIQAQYTDGGDKVHMCYGFDFLSPKPLTGTRVAEVLGHYESIVRDGWACWAFSNHDVVRHVTRWNLNEDATRLYAALLLSLRGTVCLYQGEELGLTEAYVAFEDLHDPYGIRFWPKFKGRDGCRTPIPWVQDNRNGGFTDGKPWLPLAMEHLGRAVMGQAGQVGSTLNFYRAMLALRKTHPAFAKGSLSVLEARDDYIAMIREYDGARIFCAFNLSDRDQTASLPDGDWHQDPNAPFNSTADGGTITLPPWQAWFGQQHNP